MPRRLPALLLLLLLGAAPVSAADPPAGRAELPGEVPQTGRRIEVADRTARCLGASTAGLGGTPAGPLLAATSLLAPRWAGAVEDYHRILTEVGDDLVLISPGRSVQARWLCHQRLASLPPDALRLFRQRADAPARKWLEGGIAGHDAKLLQRVVREAFCSRSGDAALDLLGDLAFERGRYEEASQWWRLIARPVTEAAGLTPPVAGLLFPDPQVDVARVRAKLLLARLFAGEGQVRGPSRKAELKAFRELHPKAAGRLAGRHGNYADTLQAVLAEQGPPAPPAETMAWPTFAGSPFRNRVPVLDTKRLERLASRGPRWAFELEKHRRIKPKERLALPVKPAGPLLRNRRFAFHPVIVGQQVLIADARHVTAYDTRSGEATVWYDAAQAHVGLDGLLNTQLPGPPDLSYTLTVAEDCVFARLGVQDFTTERQPQDSVSLLVCLELRPGKDGDRVRWEVQPDEQRRDGAVFEGAPVVRDGRAYIAVTRIAGGQTITAIHCYGVAGHGRPPLRWKQDVCSTQEIRNKEVRWRHHLLGFAGPYLVYCSHSGAVLALDPDTGRRVWAVRYPSRGPLTADARPSPRTLAPCLFADGRVYVAPVDSDRLLCLDALTGQTLWERQGFEVVHLLGVAHGRLVFTFAATTEKTGQAGIRAVDAATGTDTGGWTQPADGYAREPLGRGLLAGDLVLWPAVTGNLLVPDGLFVLDVRTGDPVLNPGMDTKVRAGNLALGNGILAVTTDQRLFLYLAPALEREEREKQVQADPTSAAAHRELAIAESDAGLGERALASFDRAAKLAGNGPLHGAVLAGKHEALLHMARQAEAARHWDEAAAALARAAGEEFAVPERLHALARLADLWETAQQPEKAVAAWQRVLHDARLRRGTVADADGNPQSGAVLAAASIDRLRQQHGPAVYAAVEKEARELLASAGGQRVETLERLAVEYPNAAATASALPGLGRLHEQAGRHGAAAQAYRQFLRRAGKEPQAAPVIARLARVYEREGCGEAARATWQVLAQWFGDRTLPELDGERPVRDFVSAHLKQPQFTAPSEPAWPVRRTGELTLPPGGRLLAADGPDAADLAFVAAPHGNGGRLTCQAGEGPPRWSCLLPFVPAWVGCRADTLLAGGPGGVTALRLDDGKPAWELPLPGELAGFRLAGDRLFFLQEECRLLALKVRTGQVLWGRWAPASRLGLPPPAGRFRPHFHAGPECVVVQTSGGRRLALDAATGRLIHDAETTRGPWACPPVVLRDGPCLPAGNRQVGLFDPAAGRDRWDFTLTGASTLTGEPPQLLGNGEALVVFVPRNYGWRWRRLDPSTGQPLWPEERPFDAEALNAGRMAIDREAVYHAGHNVLRACSLDDGRLLWECPLAGPSGRWQVAKLGSMVIAWPLDVFTARLRLGWWSSRDVLLHFPLDDSARFGFPVVICDAKTGRLVQRLNFAAGGRRVQFRDAASGGEGARPAVWLSGRRLLVSVEGRAWRLAALPAAP